MAKPDCDDGWKKFAHELFSALCYAGFTKRQWIVLNEVFEQIYGPALLRTADLYPLDLARRSGLRREHVWHAIRELVDDGILAPVSDTPGNTIYHFNKDYEAWRNKGRDRFNPTEVEAIRSAPSRARILTLAALGARAKVGTQTGSGACQSRHAARAKVGTRPCRRSARASEERRIEEISVGHLVGQSEEAPIAGAADRPTDRPSAPPEFQTLAAEAEGLAKGWGELILTEREHLLASIGGRLDLAREVLAYLSRRKRGAPVKNLVGYLITGVAKLAAKQAVGSVAAPRSKSAAAAVPMPSLPEPVRPETTTKAFRELLKAGANGAGRKKENL